jgi:predicted transcriptional regulator
METLINLDAGLTQRIEKLAKLRQLPTSSLMREAIQAYLDKEEQREMLNKEMVQAWEAYQKDGLHLTHAEVDQWLTQLAEGKDVEPPKCHK